MSEPQNKSQLEAWCVIELLGHLTLAGRVDIPQADGTFATQFFASGSIYRISLVSEEVARAKAATTSYAPVSAWDLSRRLPAPAGINITDGEPSEDYVRRMRDDDDGNTDYDEDD